MSDQPSPNQDQIRSGVSSRSAERAALSGSRAGSAGGAKPVVVTHNLAKRYGQIEALKGVSVSVSQGEIYGLLGQNGAGKTTLVKVLLGITKSSFGDAMLLGEPAGTPDVRRLVGYLPEDHRFPDYHSGYSLLDYYGALLEVPRKERQSRIHEMLEFVGLKSRMHYKVRTYSKGMKQRLGIAQAVFHDPQVIFLDEPTDGVDPIGRRQIRQLMEQLKQEGKTIFLNSHLLGEVELVCDRVAILHRGEKIKEGTIADLTRHRGAFLIGLAPGQTLPGEELSKQGYAVSQVGERWEVALTDGQSIDPVIDLLRARGLSLRHLEERRQTLEEIFMETVVAAEPADEPVRRRRRPSY